MTNFICIEGTDYGASEFTIGSGGEFVPSRDEMYANTSMPMCWAGFFKPQWLEICKKHNLKFYNLDTGYFGNVKKKIYFRVSVNEFQITRPIIERPADRWEKLNINLESFKRGNHIVIVPPDRKIVYTLGLGTEDLWIESVVHEIKKFTDRPIRIRKRPETRSDRIVNNTFKDFIKDDTHCVIGFQSNALVEAAMCDIPVISLGNSATKSIYHKQIEDIENLNVVSKDEKQLWLNHLSYSQFTREELTSGFAWDIVSNYN
jgi:hypothetical protein